MSVNPINLGRVTAYADAVAAGYTGTREEFATDLANAATYASSAGASAESAHDDAESAAGSASDAHDDAVAAAASASDAHDDALAALGYKNDAHDSATNANTDAGLAANSKTAAAASALVAEGYAEGKQNGETVTSDSPYYQNNAKYFSNQADGSATEASGYKDTAGAKALVSEGYAAGTQNGEAVASGSPYYENNGAYYASEAAASAATSAAMTGLAPAFSASMAYSAGDYVLYNGTLYRFTAAHAAGAWTGTDATAVTLGPDVSELKSDLSDTELALDYPWIWIQGGINSSGETQADPASVRTDFIPFKYFYEFYKPIGIQLSVFFYDANAQFIDRVIYYQNPAYTKKQADFISHNATYVKFVALRYGQSTTTPADIVNTDLAIKCFYCIDMLVNNITDITNDIIVSPNNLADHSTILPETQINASGITSANSAYATTDFIPVKEGQEIFATFGLNIPITLARVCTYTKHKRVISGATTSVTSFTVPAGCYFIRFCATNVYMASPFLRINVGERRHYEDYYKKDINGLVAQNVGDVFSLKNYPLTTLPEYIVNNLAYKPLGQLSKGYICFVSDDGDAAVETYTIPMFESKEVPCTLAMMSTSGVLQTQSGLNAVLDAVNNHGFCVAQHGGSYWTTNYDEYELNWYFDNEEAYWNSIGITVYGACAPGHQVNNWIRALCGGRFGCHRAAYYDGTPYYSYYINGPRSNMYSLTSENIVEGTLQTWKDKCDETLTNHWLMMIHLHENELTADDKTKMEAVIDYAKSIGLIFCTMKEIQNLI